MQSKSSSNGAGEGSASGPPTSKSRNLSQTAAAFFGKIWNRSRQNDSTLLTVKDEKHGLFVLYPPLEIQVAEVEFDVDIIAVHGLNGDAIKTWTDTSSSKLWLRDFLPKKIPSARVMTFGYDSSLAFSRSLANLDDFALDLLDRLRGARSSAV